MIFAANTLHDVLSLTESQRPHPSTWNPDPETTNCYYMYVPPSRKGRGGGQNSSCASHTKFVRIITLLSFGISLRYLVCGYIP